MQTCSDRDVCHETSIQQEGIWSAGQVAQLVSDDKGWRPSNYQVIKVLRNNFGMHYRPVKRIPIQRNSERCKVLRQVYAMRFLDLLESWKRIINIDESWIGETDFRKKRWAVPGSTNSLPENSVSPRISVLAAIDTDGELYFALKQVNTDTRMMQLFLQSLVKKLSKADKNWRDKSIIVLDGAPYHKSEVMKKTFQMLKLQVVITAPYSYQSSPIELFFAALKRGNINQMNLRTSKR